MSWLMLVSPSFEKSELNGRVFIFPVVVKIQNTRLMFDVIRSIYVAPTSFRGDGRFNS